MLAIIEAYGGAANIGKTANCATRLRFDVKSADKVSEA
ncbi:MAG: PTS transporter subunit EIIB, partial [Chlamydiia bacterium]|nr:PTS transporter subunit EIIB [Chlamydiia bacterium]